MKHFVTLLALIGVFSSMAQPTLEYANFPTEPMQFQVYVMLDDGGTLEPTDGASQNWQYSAMTWLLAGTAVLGPASTTPYTADYPAANIAWTLDPSLGPVEYQYFVLSPTGFEMVATEVPAAPDVFTDQLRTLQFPLSLGGSFSDTYASSSGSDSVTWTFTGYGTFITTEGTFTDQIKMKNSVDDVVIWNASPIHPRFYVTSGDVFLFIASPTSIDDPGTSENVWFFPSPCTNELTVEGLGAGPWRITDMAGRTVLSGSSDGSPQQQIDVSALTTGSYLLMTEGDQRPMRFVKE